MILKKRKLRHYLIEFLLVFSSVLGAFLVEDFIIKREEQKAYKGCLRSFQEDLKLNIKAWEMEIDTGGYVSKHLTGYSVAFDLLDSRDKRRFMNASLNSLLWVGFGDEPIYSKNYEKLVSEYHSQIQLQELKKKLPHYEYFLKHKDYLRVQIQEHEKFNFEVTKDFYLDFNSKNHFSDFNIKVFKEREMPIRTQISRMYHNMSLYMDISEYGITALKQIDSLVTEEINGW